MVTYEEFSGRAADLFDWIASGKFTIRIAKEFNMAQARESHEFLHSRAAIGKVLLSINPALK